MTNRFNLQGASDGIAPRLSMVSDTPELDTQVLLAHVLDRPRSWLLAHPETPLTRAHLAKLDALVKHLEAGEPLPYLLGRWEFFGLEFEVNQQVLIPRPETELLVERAIAWLMKARSEKRTPNTLDVGTGSGCIGIALAVNVPGLQVEAADISPDAIKVARRNAARHGVAERVKFLCSDLLSDISCHPSFDLITANLPYISSSTLLSLPVHQYEPALALDGGKDGLALIRRFLVQVPGRLNPGGLLLMEIEASQGARVLRLAGEAFAGAEIHLVQDLGGRDRMLEVLP